MQESGHFGPVASVYYRVPRLPRSVEWNLVLAPVLGAACALWMSGTLPPPRPFSQIAAFGWAIQCVLLAWVVASGMVAAFVPNLAFALRGGLPAVWLGPIYVLFRTHSPWAVVATALFFGTLAANVRRCRKLPAEAEPIWTAATPITLPQAPAWPVAAMVAGLAIQTAAIAAGTGWLVAGSILAGGSAAFYAWRDQRYGWQRRDYMVGLAGAMAFFLTISSLRPYVSGSSGQAEDLGFRARRITIPKPAKAPPKGAQTVEIGTTFEAVVLWPETEPITKLVPPLPGLRSSLETPSTVAEPLSIPFYGAYWFLQNQLKQPPPNAAVLRGTPTERSLRTTTRRPLTMEAHQNLGTLLPISCCGRVDLAIRNADRYPGSVVIELLLSNTVEQSASVSLGRQQVTTTMSRHSWGEPETELLRFPMPLQSGLSSFDEFSIRFHLNQLRADKAAKIAIDRFILVPRGG